MADAVLTLATIMITLIGAVLLVWQFRHVSRARAVRRRGRSQRLQGELAAVDEYISKISRAATDEELERLASDYEKGSNGK